ncbi:MAG: hypothetical protein AB8G22_12200, partial [Saprospiraceae bacterium]
TLVVLMANNYQKAQLREVEFFEEQIQTNLRTTELLERQASDKYSDLRYVLTDFSKAKYQDCGLVAARIFDSVDKVSQSLAEQLKIFSTGKGNIKKYQTRIHPTLHQQLIKLREEVRMEMDFMLEKGGRRFGIIGKDSIYFQTKWHKRIDLLMLELAIPKHPLVAHLHLSRLSVEVENLRLFLIQEIADLSDFRSTNCGIGLGAVIMPTQHGRKVGDKFKANIGFGYYSLPLESTDFSISVNGDTLPMGEQGNFLFETVIGAQREVEFEIEYKTRSFVTGQVEDYSRKQEYTIPLP